LGESSDESASVATTAALRFSNTSVSRQLDCLDAVDATGQVKTAAAVNHSAASSGIGKSQHLQSLMQCVGCA